MKACSIWLGLLTLSCAHGLPVVPPLAPRGEETAEAPTGEAPPVLAPRPASMATEDPDLALDLASDLAPDLAPGRYWYRNGEACAPLDVEDRPSGVLEVSSPSDIGGGGRTRFFVVRDGSLSGAGSRDAVHSFDRACGGPGFRFTPDSGWSFAGVPLFDMRAACEALACGDGDCLARFEYGDCADAAAASAARIRALRDAPEAARLRTFDRFRRIGRRARLWRRGRSACVPVEASRVEGELELHSSEDVEGGRLDTTERYVVSPLDSRAVLLSSIAVFAATGGGVGTLGGRHVTLAFGDGVVLLGNDDYFFARRACEASGG